MAEWVRTDVDFGETGARLVCDKTWLAARTGLDVGRLLAEGPALAEKVLRDVIADVRPDLAGGVLVGVRFDFPHRQWEFLYLHPALPRWRPGEESRVVRLDWPVPGG